MIQTKNHAQRGGPYDWGKWIFRDSEAKERKRKNEHHITAFNRGSTGNRKSHPHAIHPHQYGNFFYSGYDV